MAGTVRENLLLSSHSPCTDKAIVSVLEQLQIWDRIHEHGGLDASIGSIRLTESQRRLLCIGRALLQPGSIVILDEPTSGFDEDTGRVVQELIREVFKGRLVVSVAHKMDTIIDSDLIVVMDHGQVAEMGPPLDLLKKKDDSQTNIHSPWPRRGNRAQGQSTPERKTSAMRNKPRRPGI
ncbi:hypothetical protein MY10362_009245 [Beauveria mimosiformis]